ncbi:MAG: sigma-70 family RNA polymerase sigma factor [Lewinellaceae bacterium]|nr:sigma-70 family RNA polymerase sigma factor [Lewinella sp.]MCB9277519.1 sigma-70 family RNA polymerase sigma factor [Lewinellaceae bacterium]
MDEIDSQLVEQAQSGDKRALNRLFTLWYPRVYNLAFRYFADPDQAAEICQQTFLSIHKRLAQLRDPGSFKGWLFRTAINYCHEEGRTISRRARHQENLNNQPANGLAQSPHEQVLRSERARIIMAALQKIPADQREVILMKEYEDLKFREIAEILDVSVNTVKSRLYYGLNALRKLLTDCQLLNELYHE